MYPYMVLKDETEIVHSHVKNENGIKTVLVHFERPKPYGFDSARITIPSYNWIMRDGFSDDEIAKFEQFTARHAHNFFYYAENGGISVAEAI